MRRFWLLLAMIAACRFEPRAAPDDGGAGAEMIDSVLPEGFVPGAWLHPWTRRKAFSLLETQIEAPGDGSLADFPVLITADDPDIGAIAKTDGSDIVFTSGDALSRLDSEIESYSNGAFVAWVKVPVLSATANTELFVYYGKPNHMPSDHEDVWTGGYRGVWHLNQAPDPDGDQEIKDATTSDLDGSAEVSMMAAQSVSAQIGNGIRFDGTGDFIDFPTTDFGNEFTLAIWVNVNNGNGIKTLVANSLSGPTVDGFRWFINDNGTSNKRIVFETGDGSQRESAETNTGAVVQDTWTHVAVTVDRNAALALIYVNGVEVAVDEQIQNDFGTSATFEVARMGDLFRFVGMLDELEVSSLIRPREWLATQVRNQGMPAAFRTPFAVEEVEP